MKKKMYYIANARMPSEKAHGIQIAKMCEAFVEQGIEVILVVPERRTKNQSLKEFYDLRVEIPLIHLFAFDLYNYGRIGYRISSYSFMISYTWYLFWKKMSNEDFFVYTIDLDNFSSTALSLTCSKLYTEMHRIKPQTFSQKMFFKKLSGVITINSRIRDELQKGFLQPNLRYIIEPNAVDHIQFKPISKKEARQKLGISLDTKIVLYAGRFFEWKGLEIIDQVAKITKDIEWFVIGGTKEEFKDITKITDVSSQIMFPGAVSHTAIPTWLAAADVLLVLGTSRDIQSYQETSPMKLFEYLVMERPIVASGTPAIHSIVSEKEVLFYEPDNSQSLALQIEKAIEYPENYDAQITAAKTLGTKYSWRDRATRIIDFIKDTL